MCGGRMSKYPDIQDYTCAVWPKHGAYRVSATVGGHPVVGWVPSFAPIVTPYLAANLRAQADGERRTHA